MRICVRASRRTLVYQEMRLNITLEDGRPVTALTYIVDHDHEQYAGRLPTEELLRLIRQGVGVSGKNPEYVIATGGASPGDGCRGPAARRALAGPGRDRRRLRSARCRPFCGCPAGNRNRSVAGGHCGRAALTM